MTDDRGSKSPNPPCARATFGPAPGQVEALNAGGPGRRRLKPGCSAATTTPRSPGDSRLHRAWEAAPSWWMLLDGRIPPFGLAEKMTVFLATAATSATGGPTKGPASWLMMWENQHMLAGATKRPPRELPPTMLAGRFTIDPAMVDLPSTADPVGGHSPPNENYSREVMELFAVGARGNYNIHRRPNVRNGAKGARAWAWTWNWDTGVRHLSTRSKTPAAHERRWNGFPWARACSRYKKPT